MAYFGEKFIDNRNNWSFFDDQDKVFTFQDGVAVFEHRKLHDWWAHWLYVPDTVNGEFEARTVIRCEKAPINGWFGFVWNLSDVNNFLALKISLKGNYQIVGMDDGIWKTNIHPRNLPQFLNIHEEQEIVINQKYDDFDCDLRIHIKQHLYSECLFDDTIDYPITGDKVGFIAGPATKLIISSLYVKEYTKQSNGSDKKSAGNQPTNYFPYGFPSNEPESIEAREQRRLMDYQDGEIWGDDDAYSD